MQCVVACGAAVPWAMQVGLKRRHVVRGSSRRTALAAAREFVQLRKHKTMSPDPFSPLDYFVWKPRSSNNFNAVSKLPPSHFEPFLRRTRRSASS